VFELSGGHGACQACDESKGDNRDPETRYHCAHAAQISFNPFKLACPFLPTMM
jgi:hypothetical protein